ncbi:MAG: methyltransferase [Rickettsiales bacterium]|nr:methyltransferase [Rickettsiales bacterium]
MDTDYQIKLDLKILYLLNDKYLQNSKSQLRQDLFVLHELNFKKQGFFVEFGATNGVEFSNSYLLEKEYQWNGILCEPSRGWHKELTINRPKAIIDKRCIWKKSGEKINFRECHANTLSTIDEFKNCDTHSKERHNGINYQVSSVTLTDLLQEHNAPHDIDYLSIDTEGSEYEILASHDFNKYSFKVITCEHNFTSKRNEIFRLLLSKGYERKYLRNDKTDFDDWYVKTY